MILNHKNRNDRENDIIGTWENFKKELKKTSIQYSQEKRIMFKQFQQSNQKILEEIIYELREGRMYGTSSFKYVRKLKSGKKNR